MSAHRDVARRLIALLGDEREIETAPIDEIGLDLRLLEVDPAPAIAQTRRLASAGDTPAAHLLARMAQAEASEREIEELERAPIEEAHARLLGAGAPPASRERREDWLSQPVIVGLLRLLDGAVVVLAVLAAYLTRFHSLDDLSALELHGAVLAAVLTVNVLQLAGLYRFSELTNLPGQAGRLLLAWATVMLCLLALGFMAKAPLDATSRLWVGLSFVYGFFGLVTARLLLKQQIRRWQAEGRLTRNIAILGAGEPGRRLLQHLRQQDDPALRIVGVFDDCAAGGEIAGLPILGTVDELVTFARRQRVDQIIIAQPWEAEPHLQAWMRKLGSLPVDVAFCPHVASAGLARRRITRVAGLPMLSVLDKPLTGWSYIVKSMEDRVLAAAVLLVIAPLLAILALLVKLDSRGPVLFRQKRYGLNNEVIEVFKFRTLYAQHCDDRQVVPVSRNDPRVTRIGRILRRTSLDELPQFLNVLRGTMSIVGPRPHAVAHDQHYARLIEAYLARQRVKPGITGWAQVNGLRGEIDTLERMEQRVRHDLYYIENWSLLFDLRIILRTAFVAFRDSYAY